MSDLRTIEEIIRAKKEELDNLEAALRTIQSIVETPPPKPAKPTRTRTPRLRSGDPYTQVILDKAKDLKQFTVVDLHRKLFPELGTECPTPRMISYRLRKSPLSRYIKFIEWAPRDGDRGHPYALYQYTS